MSILALGDHVFKLPTVYTTQIFGVLGGRGFMKATNEFIHRIMTTPYISNLAEVRHIELPELAGAEGTKRLLILASDGLVDVGIWPSKQEAEGQAEKIAQRWVDVAAEASAEGAGAPTRALAVLRDALGGVDEEKVSRMVTVEMNERWVDDTTILVQVI